MIRLTLARTFFLYIAVTLSVVLLTAFFVLERNQSRQWEEYLRSQSVSFARFAAPEILKQFRGSFPAPDAAHLAGMYDFLGFNRDLIRFSIYSPTGRLLFESPLFPDYIDLPLTEFNGDEQTLSDRLHVPRTTLQTAIAGDGRRLLDLITPAFGPTGEQTVAVRFLISYDSVDRLVQAMRIDLLQIGALVLIGALLLAAGISRRVTRPISRLTAGARAVGGGDLRTRIALHGDDELAVLAQAFNDMADNLLLSRNALTEKNVDLERSNVELRQVQEQLIRSERLAAIGQLAAGVSHEIDNPIGIILGYAELLLDDFLEGDPRRDDLLAIIEECRRCRRITGGLLGFARTRTSSRVEVDPVQLASDTLDSLRPQKLFRSVELSLLNPQQIEQRVIADSDQLRQILVNLLLNAAQAMAGKGRIVLSIARRGDWLQLNVQDSGPGIPANLREQIFEPFFSTKPSGEGTGLGLSLCRRLAEEMGGDLNLCPQERGACFRLELPLATGEKSFDSANDQPIG